MAGVATRSVHLPHLLASTPGYVMPCHDIFHSYGYGPMDTTLSSTIQIRLQMCTSMRRIFEGICVSSVGELRLVSTDDENEIWLIAHDAGKRACCSYDFRRPQPWRVDFQRGD